MIIHSSQSDFELTELLKFDDRAAFTELYNRYKGLLYIYACKITMDDDLAEDIVQELFVKIWDKRQSLNFTTSVSSYFYTSIKHKFFDLLDRQKISEAYLQAIQLFLDSGENSTDSYIREKELASIIEKEIYNLPSKMREIFLLSRKENLSNNEIAALLDISEKTVRNQLSTALKTLKTKLGLATFLLLLIHFK